MIQKYIAVLRVNCCKFSSYCLFFGAIFAGTYGYEYATNILHFESDEQIVVHVDRQAACQ